MKKIVILGGSGAQASYGVFDLVQSGYFDEIVIADLNLEKAQELVKRIDSPKVSAVHVDVLDHDKLFEVIQGADVVANCTGPYHKLVKPIIETVIEAKIDYIDICDDPAAFYQVFEDEALLEKAKQADISMIVGLGASPGRLSVVAMDAMDRYFDHVETANFYFCCSEKEPQGPAVMAHMMECLGKPVGYYEGKELKQNMPFDSEWEFDFKKPFGKHSVSLIGHPEVFTFPRAFPEVENVSIRFGLEPESAYNMYKAIAKLGMASSIPVPVKGIQVSPCEYSLARLIQMMEHMPKQTPEEVTEMLKTEITAISAVELFGEKDGKHVEYVAHIKGNMAPATAIPMTIGAEMLAQGKVSKKGLMVTEEAIEEPAWFCNKVLERVHANGFMEEVSEKVIIETKE